MNKRNIGATLAAAAALTFATAPVSTVFAADDGKVQCYGVNACKGQSSCKTAKNGCHGENACKGQGIVMTTADDCQAKGGTTEEPKS